MFKTKEKHTDEDVWDAGAHVVSVEGQKAGAWWHLYGLTLTCPQMPWPALIYVCSAALTYPVYTHIDTFRHMQTQTDTDKQTQMLQKKERSGKDTQILSVLLWQGHSFATYTLFQVFCSSMCWLFIPAYRQKLCSDYISRVAPFRRLAWLYNLGKPLF